MMAFDRGGTALAAFDDVRINGALHQKVLPSERPALVFEDADEFLTDDFSLFLGLRDAGQFA